MPLSTRSSAYALAALLGTAGVSHFAVPKIYDAMIPPPLPGDPRVWTYGSGALELVVSGALLVPRTRTLGGLAAAGLFVGVLPANVQMAVDARRGASRSMQVGTLLRLPLQVPLVVAAWRVFRRTGRGTPLR
ncbi:MAG: DoxX family protein [Jatrophihabitantaceae bacterium]